MGREQQSNRKSVRLQQYDYGSTGAYFITSCAQHHATIFGHIGHGIMCLNDLGAKVWDEWFKSFEKRTDFSPGAFIVMPNHWHGIIHILRQPHEHWKADRIEHFGGSKKDTFATMLKGMKSAVTSFAIAELNWEGKLWQRGFYDHVIRNREEYERIDVYIVKNTRNWPNDRFHP